MVKNKILIVIHILIFTLVMTSAKSEEFVKKYQTSDKYDSCTKRAQSAQYYLSCMQIETKHQDLRLIKNYKTALESIENERRNSLRDIHRLWIDYRNGKCLFYHHKRSGSGGLMDYKECMMRETIIRADELAEIQ